ncbi:MAG: hypothetical protein Q9169_005872 [Polycauliona sp. 2 TL-2023]
MLLVPQGHSTDVTRVLDLSSSAEPIFIGRASKTASKGLLAAPENAWFDSPIMSRQHGKIFMSSSGAVHIQDLASTHGTWIRNKRLAANETCVVHDQDLITFGSTVTSGPASPTSSSYKGSDQSGFRVPDGQYESLSDDSDVNDCKILSSHPRTFSVPSSGDEMDESDDELRHIDTVITARRTVGDAREPHRGSDIAAIWDHAVDQKQSPTTESHAGTIRPGLNSGKTSRIAALYDDDTEDEEPTHAGQPKRIERRQSANNNSLDRRSSSPDIEIPDTYASFGIPKEKSKSSQHVNEVRHGYESDMGRPLSGIKVSEWKTNQDDGTGHDSSNALSGFALPSQEPEVRPFGESNANKQQPVDVDEMDPPMPIAIPNHRHATFHTYESSPEPEQDVDLSRRVFGYKIERQARADSLISQASSLDLLSDSSEDDSEDDDSLFCQAPPTKRGSVAATRSETADDQTSRLADTPLPPRMQALDAFSRPHTDSLSSASWGPPKPIIPPSASLATLPQAFNEYPLHPSESVSNFARAPSPSDAALVRKASPWSNTYYPGGRHDSSAVKTPAYNVPTAEELSFTRPISDTTMYFSHGDGFGSASAYSKNNDDHSYLEHLKHLARPDSRRDEYQQGPFSRKYGWFPSDMTPAPSGRWSTSPLPEARHKSCLVKLKVDAKTANEDFDNLSPCLDEAKPKKVDISNLVNPHAEGTRSLKRKSDQMSSDEGFKEDNTLATLESSSSQTDGDEDLGHDAQAREPVMAGSETITQELGSGTIPPPIEVTRDAAERGPARKKVKVSRPKAGTVGKFVSGVCLGLAGAFAAFIAATPSDVWDEALREAAKLA